MIADIDVNDIKRKYRESRLRLEAIFESKHGKEGLKDMSAGAKRSPVVSLDIDNRCWCPHCVEYFAHCLLVHNKETFELVGGLFTKYILYRCRSKGHMFHVKSIRKQKYQKQYKIQEYTCPDCLKEKKEEERRLQAEELDRQRQKIATEQRAIFEKARLEEEER